jgi:hypothetical protein
MRSIIVYTVGFGIMGLIHAQNRRMISDFTLREYLDLAVTGMGTEKANAFINKVCSNPYAVDLEPFGIKAAINVETNQTLAFWEYQNGPGAEGKKQYGYAIYPWSTVRGSCLPILNSSWVTDRVSEYGPAAKNTNLRYWNIMPVIIDAVIPIPIATTTITPLQGTHRHDDTDSVERHDEEY